MRCINLIKMCAAKRISYTSIAKVLGISQRSVQNKINGITNFTFQEARLIRDTFFAEMSLEELFTNEE